MLKKDSITFLRLFKFLIPKKGSMTFLRLLRFLILKKDSITYLRLLLKVWILKNDSITFLRLLKVFQNNYSVECWWTAASASCLSYHIFINELDLPSVPNLIALGIYFLFGIKFSMDEGTVIWFNVKCV